MLRGLLVGMFFRGVHDVLVHRNIGRGALVGILYITETWMDFESNFSLVVGLVTSIGFIIFFNLAVKVVSNLRAVTLAQTKEQQDYAVQS